MGGDRLTCEVHASAGFCKHGRHAIPKRAESECDGEEPEADWEGAGPVAGAQARVFVARGDEFASVAVLPGGEGVEHLDRIAKPDAALKAALGLRGGIDWREGVAADSRGADIPLSESGPGEKGARCEDDEFFHGNLPYKLDRKRKAGRPCEKRFLIHKRND